MGFKTTIVTDANVREHLRLINWWVLLIRTFLLEFVVATLLFRPSVACAVNIICGASFGVLYHHQQECSP